jgi:type II secretory pathway component PulC
MAGRWASNEKHMTISKAVRIPSLAVLGLALASATVRAEKPACAVEIPRGRLTQFLLQMRSNPAIRDGEIVGFRIYEKSAPGVLPELGLRSGDLLTHFCGVSFNDAFSAKEAICCTVQEPMPNGVELRVERDGKVIRVVAPMPNKPLQSTR